jgi:hypothetical protein
MIFNPIDNREQREMNRLALGHMISHLPDYGHSVDVMVLSSPRISAGAVVLRQFVRHLPGRLEVLCALGLSFLPMQWCCG